MKRTPNMRVENFRMLSGPLASTQLDVNNGAFQVPYKGTFLTVVISDGDGWDHVSVSLTNRCPMHDEMEHIRGLFFHDDETVVLFSVPRSKHINVHPFCLHMWRDQNTVVKLPPEWMVG